MKRVDIGGLLTKMLKRFSGTESTTLNLGELFTAGFITQAGSRLYFTIPTGRVFPAGTTITNLTCNLTTRVGNANGGGLYVTRGNSTSAATSVTLTINDTSAFSFYNGANSYVSIPAANTHANIVGNTNISVWLDGDPNSVGTVYKFVGNSTNNGYCNNQPAAVQIYNLVVTLKFPNT